MTRASSATRMPATPPAAQPCARRAETEKRSSCAFEVMKTASRSSSSRSAGACAAPTTVSSPLRVRASHSVRPLGAPCPETRLTTPWRVPSTMSRCGSTSARTVSPFSRSTRSLTGVPPASAGRVACGGRCGRWTTSSASRRPRFVSAASVPRTVDGTCDTSASWLARRPSSDSGERSVVRAARPEVERSTQQGPSETVSDCWDFRPFADSSLSEPSTRTVRRGSVSVSATSPSSVATSSRSADSSFSSVWSCSMSARRSSRSASSSRRENRVRRRSCRSRMYVAWISERSKTSMRRVRAVAASSEPRMSWMTSSMSRIAMRRPSTRWRRSCARPSRCRVRRRTTSMRWSM